MSIAQFEPTGQVRVVIDGADESEVPPSTVMVTLDGEGRLEGLSFDRWARPQEPFVITALPAGVYRYKTLQYSATQYQGEGTIEVAAGRVTRLVLQKHGR